MSTPSADRRQRSAWLPAAAVVGAVLLIAATLVIGVVVRRNLAYGAWTQQLHTEFTFCGRRIELRDGYIGAVKPIEFEDESLDTFVIVPLDLAARPETLDDLVTQPGALSPNALDLPPLSDAIDEAARLEQEHSYSTVDYSTTTYDRCVVSTRVDGGVSTSLFSPRQPWGVEVTVEER